MVDHERTLEILLERDAQAAFARAVVEQFMGETPRRSGLILEDEAVRRSVAEQRPISGVNAESPVPQALEDIVRDLGSDPVVAAANKQPKTINVMTASADIRE